MVRPGFPAVSRCGIPFAWPGGIWPDNQANSHWLCMEWTQALGGGALFWARPPNAGTYFLGCARHKIGPRVSWLWKKSLPALTLPRAHSPQKLHPPANCSNFELQKATYMFATYSLQLIVHILLLSEIKMKLNYNLLQIFYSAFWELDVSQTARGIWIQIWAKKYLRI